MEENPKLACEEEVLVFHILPKLPVKSLSRFKCVCKKWLRWISDDPVFIREQSRFSLANPRLTYMSYRGLEFIATGGNRIDVPDPSLSFIEGFGNDVVASCNGLLCVYVCRPVRAFSVCNPVSREWHIVPHPTQVVNSLGLAFDPLDSPQSYKLVCPYLLGEGENNGPLECGFIVFSSDTGEWMESSETIVAKFPSLMNNNSVFMDGILYWFFYGEIVWFDTKKGLAGVLSPPVDGLEFEAIALGMSEGRLTCTRIVKQEMIEAWIMSGFKWTRICQGSLCSAILQRWHQCHGFVLPYQGGEFLYSLVTEDGRSFVVLRYNMKSGEVTKSHAYEWLPYVAPFFPYNNNFVHLPKLS